MGGLNGTVVITADQKDSDSKGLKLVEKQVTNKVNFVGENSNVRLKGTAHKQNAKVQLKGEKCYSTKH